MFLGDNEVVLGTSWIYAIESHKSVVLWTIRAEIKGGLL